MLERDRCRDAWKRVKKPWRATTLIFTDPQLIYYLFFVAFAFAGILQHPFFFTFHLSFIIVR